MISAMDSRRRSHFSCHSLRRAFMSATRRPTVARSNRLVADCSAPLPVPLVNCKAGAKGTAELSRGDSVQPALQAAENLSRVMHYAVFDDAVNALQIADVVERIGVEHDEIGQFAWL